MDYQIEIHHLDVGQGDSTFVIIRNGNQIVKSLLIDCGPCASTPRVIKHVKNALNSAPLDVFIISHLHKDHMGSYGSVIGELTPGKIVTNYNKTKSSESNPIVTIPQVRDELLELEPDGPKLTCLKNNSSLGTQVKDKTNAASLAFLMCYKDFRYYSGGDLESAQENALIKDIGQLSAFKLSHHGSRFSTSLEFLTATTPGLAFISCGQPDSPAPDLKHPSEHVLERLNNTSSLLNVFSTSFAAPKGEEISNYFARGCADQSSRKFKVAGYTDDSFNIVQYGDIILRMKDRELSVDFYDSSPSYRKAGAKRGFSSLRYSLNDTGVSR